MNAELRVSLEYREELEEDGNPAKDRYLSIEVNDTDGRLFIGVVDSSGDLLDGYFDEISIDNVKFIRDFLTSVIESC